jgi:alpha-glucosidase
MVMGTRAHILGMYVVYETYLQLLCDAPEAYINQPGFDFLLNVPATWDETKVLNAKVGEYIVIARRSGNNWFIGGLNNDTAREVDIPLSFLKTGAYSLEQYTDAPDATEEPNHVDYAKKQVSSGGVLRVRLAGGGGLAMTVKPAKK